MHYVQVILIFIGSSKPPVWEHQNINFILLIKNIRNLLGVLKSLQECIT